MLPANTVLQNRYRIVRQMGRGGMGAVYEAVDQRLSSIVAIKETLVTSEDARRAFEREASLLANLRQRSLPSVTDHFAEGEGQFLVMQFIPGEDLAQLLELRQSAFPPADVVHWAEELLGALEYLHSHNPPILHRDIKPANLKLTHEGELFLIDFGLSKGAAGQMQTLLTSRSVKGYTAAYAPLEQIHGGGTHPGSDLYSVGATLYHLLTNVPPVDAPTRFNALDDLQADPMLPADQINSQVPQALAQVLTQSMAMNRRNRPESASAMRRMLREAIPRPAQEAVTVIKESTPQSSALEDAVTMRKLSVPFDPQATLPSAAVIRPTEPATNTHPLTPTRSTDSLDSDVPSMRPVTPMATLKEVPSLIDRSARLPATFVPTPMSEPAAAIPQSGPEPKRRRFSTPVLVALISIPILFVLAIASMVVIPLLNKRNAVPDQPSTAAPSSTDHPTTPKPADVPAKKSFSGEFDTGKALELIYGSYDSQKKYSKWKITREDIQSLPSEDRSTGIQPGTVYTAANFAKSFTQAGVPRFFVITETVPAHYDCHACAPIIGGATFSKQGDAWQLDTVTKEVSTMGSWGSAPEGKLIKIGPERYGVVFQPGYTGQGITSESAVVIAETTENVREVLVVDQYSADNGGTCGEGLATCYSFSSKLEFVAGSNPEFYDARVTTTGTKEDKDGNVRRANAVRKFTFANGKYVPAK
jgi:serine/threonine protein kinase